MLPQIQIPDFAGTILRGEMAQASRLQALAQQRDMDASRRLDEMLPTLTPALLGADATARNSALAQLMGLGRPGFSMAAPLYQMEQQRFRPAGPDELPGLRPGTVALVNNLGGVNVVQQPDTLSAEAEAQRARIAAASRAPDRESFGAPVEMTRPDGTRVMALVGNRGTIREVGGYQPPPPTTSLVPQLGYDAEGNPVPLLPTSRGTMVPATLPDGVRYAPPTREIDLGTSRVTVDRGGATVGERRVDIVGRERDERVGQQQGSEVASAPQALRTATETMTLIDGVLRHPGLSAGTGLSGRVTRAIPGTPTFDFAQRVEQLQGRAFLEAFESLKGGGQITEAEGRKATQAIARLNPDASAADFRQALSELREIAQAAAQRARTRMPASQAQPAPPQASGGVNIPGSGMTADPPASRPPLSSFQR